MSVTRIITVHEMESFAKNAHSIYKKLSAIIFLHASLHETPNFQNF